MTKVMYDKAVTKAKSVAGGLLNRSNNNLTVEEIVLSDDEKSWLITLGWEEKHPDDLPKASLVSSIYGSYRQVYKTFYIDSESGNFLKMTKWENEK